MLVLLTGRFMKYVAEVASDGMIHVPSFINTGRGFQAILRFCLRNLNGCNVGKKKKRVWRH